MSDKMEGMNQVDQKNVHGYKPSQREFFAGLALQGMLAHPVRYTPREGRLLHWHESIAKEAYEIADKMVEWVSESNG